MDQVRRSSTLTMFRDAGGLFGGTGHNYSHLRSLIPDAGHDIVVSEVAAGSYIVAYGLPRMEQRRLREEGPTPPLRRMHL